MRAILIKLPEHISKDYLYLVGQEILKFEICNHDLGDDVEVQVKMKDPQDFSLNMNWELEFYCAKADLRFIEGEE